MNLEYIIVVLVVILFSMTAHEAMHAFMGYALGDDTAKSQGRLTFNPLKHIDPFMTLVLPMTLAFFGLPIFGGAKPVPFNPNRVRYGDWGAALVALAGPLTNFLIAFLAFGLGVVLGVITQGGQVSATYLGLIINTTVYVNLGFFIFNMIPLPPLDGSRVLYALAPDGVRSGMEYMESRGFGIILVFGLVLVFSSTISQIIITCMKYIIEFFILIFSV